MYNTMLKTFRSYEKAETKPQNGIVTSYFHNFLKNFDGMATIIINIKYM